MYSYGQFSIDIVLLNVVLIGILFLFKRAGFLVQFAWQANALGYFGVKSYFAISCTSKGS